MFLLPFLGVMLVAYPAMAETPAASAETVQAPQAAPASGTPQAAPAPQAASTPEAAQAAAAPEVRQAALKQRATAWWDALIRKDFSTAYSLTSPGYRKLYSLDAFKSKFDKGSDWRRAEVLNVDFKNEDSAMVGIKMYFVYHQPQTGKALDMQNYIQEPWIFMDGQWWYLVKD